MRVRFGEFTLDSDERRLLRGDAEVHLTPKAFDLLALLIEEAPRAVRKERIYESIWPDTVVEAANLNNLVSEVRKALGDEGKATIQTRPRFGYSFAAELIRKGKTASPERTWRLSMGKTNFLLERGRNLIGRDDDCTVVIDSPEVSRHHAMIEIGDDGATIEDLGSKNGTFVEGERIGSRVPLPDRAEIGFGRTVLRFRSYSRKPTTLSDPYSR